MFDWYFKNYFIENNILFWICMTILLMIIIITVFFVHKELRGNHVNK